MPLSQKPATNHRITASGRRRGIWQRYPFKVMLHQKVILHHKVQCGRCKTDLPPFKFSSIDSLLWSCSQWSTLCHCRLQHVWPISTRQPKYISVFLDASYMSGFRKNIFFPFSQPRQMLHRDENFMDMYEQIGLRFFFIFSLDCF